MALRRLLSVMGPVWMGLAVLFSTFARAQDATAAAALVGDPERGKIVFQKVGYCVNCHGWAGDGQAGSNPLSHAAGANLRKTELDTEGLTEVIKCGLPGTKIPYTKPPPTGTTAAMAWSWPTMIRAKRRSVARPFGIKMLRT